MMGTILLGLAYGQWQETLYQHWKDIPHGSDDHRGWLNLRPMKLHWLGGMAALVPTAIYSRTLNESQAEEPVGEWTATGNARWRRAVNDLHRRVMCDDGNPAVRVDTANVVDIRGGPSFRPAAGLLLAGWSLGLAGHPETFGASIRPSGRGWAFGRGTMPGFQCVLREIGRL